MPRMHDDVVCVSPRVCRSPARFSLKPRVWERTLVPVFTSVCHRFVVGLCAHRNREKTTQDCRPGRIQTSIPYRPPEARDLPPYLSDLLSHIHAWRSTVRAKARAQKAASEAINARPWYLQPGRSLPSSNAGVRFVYFIPAWRPAPAHHKSSSVPQYRGRVRSLNAGRDR